MARWKIAQWMTVVTSALLLLMAPNAGARPEVGYKTEIEAWRAKVEASLRRDNGWLTLAGRYELKPGVNTIGTGPDSNVVLNPGLSPARLGTIDIQGDKITLKLSPGVEMFEARGDPIGFSERTLKSDLDKRDWVYLGRMSFHVIKRDDRHILRFE